MTNKRKQLKQVQNQAQDGRSMVEMLGVLAIIGVLSLGGIAGYRMAMNHYQANQIAHEINMMRTDAKVKIAQGMPKLLLGSPYDGNGHLNFNANYGVQVDFPVTITDETGENEEDGYSFTLSGIPAGVCKPLATLLNGMDDTAFLEINGDDYATMENLCGKDKNEIEVAFSAENLGVSGGGSEGEEDNDPVPPECPGSTWLSADGRKCTCEDTEKTCNGGCCAGCTGGKVWNGKKCVCPAGSEPGEDSEECVCKTATPHWDGTKCTTCPTEAPWDETTKQCKCANGKIWKESRKACVDNNGGECESNADCGPGEYCYTHVYGFYNCSNEFDPNKFGVGSSDADKSVCKSAVGDSKEGKTTHFVSSKDYYITWWSAGRFCAALGRRQATLNTVKCGINPDNSACIDTDMLANLKADFGLTYDMWLGEYKDDFCGAYRLTLYNDYVYNDSRNFERALCE